MINPRHIQYTLYNILIFILSVLFLVSQAFATNSIDFPDVFTNDPLERDEILAELVDLNIVKGYDDGTYRPLTFVNRAELTKMIITAKKIDTTSKTYISCFPDLNRLDWFTPYICEAKEQGFVNGFSDGNFHPEENIALSEALSILSKAFKWDLEDSTKITTEPFFDTELNSWYISYFKYAKDKLIIQELSKYISPHRLLNRKEAAEYIYRTLLSSKGEKIIWKTFGSSDDSYQEILATDIKPAIPADYEFPSQSQRGYPNACYGFAVMNLMQYKYSSGIKAEELGPNIDWDYNFIWDDPVFDNFGKYYDTDVIFAYYVTPSYVLNKLAYGEPVTLYRNYYVNGTNVGHHAVAFSFDESGIYFGDSANGVITHIAYDEIFTNEWDQTNLNMSELRVVKGDGERKLQWEDYEDLK